MLHSQSVSHGTLIKDEALQMKERMVEAVPDLDGFHVSN